jgi:prophage regulatory protein
MTQGDRIVCCWWIWSLPICLSDDFRGSPTQLEPPTIAAAARSVFNLPAQPRRTARMQQDAAVSTDRPDRILRLPAVLDRTGLSRSTLYRKIQEGTFPKQIALGVRTAGWRESAVSRWMQNPMSFRADG